MCHLYYSVSSERHGQQLVFRIPGPRPGSSSSASRLIIPSALARAKHFAVLGIMPVAGSVVVVVSVLPLVVVVEGTREVSVVDGVHCLSVRQREPTARHVRDVL